jgi:RNA-binding protein
MARYTIRRPLASKYIRLRPERVCGAKQLECNRMQLTEKQRRHLKGLAHPLKPVVLMGNAGLTDAVVAETSRALADHELIKVRLPGAERQERDAALQALADRTTSTLVTRIGHVAVLFKPREKLSRIVLPGG